MGKKEKSIIPIPGDKYRMSVDAMNYDLEQFVPEHLSNDGKTVKSTWITLGHFPNDLQCLNAVVRKEILGRDYHDIGQYIDALKDLYSIYMPSTD